MIENNILQTWKSKAEIPANFAYWRDSVKAVNAGFSHFFWDDDDNRAFIAAHYSWFLATYDAYPLEIYRADAVRYFWLYHHGGVYIDMDTECVRPLAPLCAAESGVVLGRMGKREGFEHSIPNAVMMSSRREPFWLLVMHLLMHPYSPWTHPENLTGSIVLKDAVDAWRGGWPEVRIAAAVDAIARRLGAGLAPSAPTSRITVLPDEAFFPIDWSNPIHERYFRRAIIRGGNLLTRERVLALFPQSYLVTYWAHSWPYPGEVPR